MTPLQFTRNVRSLNRLRLIAQVLTRHGFGHVVAQIDLSRFLPVWMLRRRDRRGTADAGPSGVGQRLVAVFNELGPTFIKLGQVLSTRPDIIPPETLTEIRSLQDSVPPFDTSEAKAIIEEELGKPVEALFAWFDDKPLASASISQVYAARTHQGKEVVVKVRRPGIEDTLRHDMELLRWLAESLESLLPESRSYHPLLIVSELEELTTRELDFVNEASTTSRFAQHLTAERGVRAPYVDWALSGARVLTLEKLPGVNIDDALNGVGMDAAALDRKLIAQRLTECYFEQIFELGTFHADPHPGNILVEAPARISLIDFGQVGVIHRELMSELVTLIYAWIDGETDMVIDTLADMGAVSRNTDRRGLARSLQVMLFKYRGLPAKRIDVGVLLGEFSELVRRHEVVVPRDVSMLFKALGTVSSVVTRLDPDLDLIQILTPRLKSAMRERFSAGAVRRHATLVGWDLLSILRKAPGQIRSAMRRASSGALELVVRHENIDRLIRELDRSSNRLAFSVVIAGIIIGSSVVVSASTTVSFFGFKVQYFGIVGYLLAGILGLGLSWAIFRSGRLH